MSISIHKVEKRIPDEAPRIVFDIYSSNNQLYDLTEKDVKFLYRELGELLGLKEKGVEV